MVGNLAMVNSRITKKTAAVDALMSPTVDPMIINQISKPQTKKYVQEYDKEYVLWYLNLNN